jgi:hypothetical protein
MFAHYGHDEFIQTTQKENKNMDSTLNLEKEIEDVETKGRLDAIKSELGMSDEDIDINVDDNDDDLEDSEDQEQILEESESDEESEKPEKKPAKAKSKEISAIIELKREKKRLADDLKKAQETLAQIERQKSQETLAQKYIEEGDSETTAKYKAAQELQLSEMNEKIAISEFKADNAKLLEKYPEAKLHIKKIMKDMEATGDSAETRCEVMFKDTRPEREVRAEKAARGQLESNANNDNTVSRANRSAEQPTTLTLTAREKALQQELEKQFGEKWSAKDVRKYIAKHL